MRERDALLRRIAVARPAGAGRARHRVGAPGPRRGWCVDLEHHRQRLNDLVYDSVALELGGSE